MATEVPPVVLMFFQRPEHLRRVFAQVAAARPSTLLLIADGPRPDHPEDVQNCEQCRKLVENIAWDCRVLRNYSDTNIGCRRRISSGLNWVFEQVEAAIILEDDCLPHPSFFPYCAELLNHYRDDGRIMHIGGSNLQLGKSSTRDSYYFSKYCHVWGWATWRRAWKHYDVQITAWKNERFRSNAARRFGSSIERRFWAEQYDAVAEGRIDTWDHQWQFTCWSHGAWGITPDVNLISNIGFGTEATHTHEVNRYMDLPLRAMDIPLRHPTQVKQNVRPDKFEFDDHYWGRDYWEQNTMMGLAKRAARKALRMAGLIKAPTPLVGPGIYVPDQAAK